MLSQHARAVTHRASLTAGAGARYVGSAAPLNALTGLLWGALQPCWWRAPRQASRLEHGRSRGRLWELSPKLYVTLVRNLCGSFPYPYRVVRVGTCQLALVTGQFAS